MAAYVPPHKRNGSTKPLPTPPPPVTKLSHLQKNNNNNNNNNNYKKNKENNSYRNTSNNGMAFSKECITTWFIVGLPQPDDNDHSTKLSTFTRLQHVVTDSPERNSFALVLKENYEKDARSEFSESPWILIAEKVKEDFAVSLQKLKDVIHGSEVRDIKPYVLLRFGKLLFDGNHLSDSEYTEETLKKSGFYTNVAPSFALNITNDVVPRNGLEMLGEKDAYLIILSDYTQPGKTISCKCMVNKETCSLQLRKFIANPVRLFVADVTCLEKDLDLRLMLQSKRNSYSVTEEEMEKIQDMISCAIFDEGVKGGLKWPLVKMTNSGRHSVVSTWHITSRTFIHSSMKLKVRMVNRYDFRTSEGEMAREVFLKMTNIKSKLGEEALDTEASFEMLKDNLKLIWKQFLV